jgi:tuberculosinol/isotuberculosinol synthase
MDAETFYNLSLDEVAQCVREAGTKVCVFPVKGTRRWFMLEYPSTPQEDYASAYLNAIFTRHIALYKLIFDHGLETLLSPSFDMPLMERGETYMRMAAEGLAALATHPLFLDFYDAYGVRVRFYGEYRQYLAGTPYAYLLDRFDTLTTHTKNHNRHRLFFGLFVHDAAETVANLAVQYYREHGSTPDRQTLIEAYYGEAVTPVDIFIGFSKLRVFDMPLLMMGKTDLYFTVSPSLYLNQRQLRAILYDHLYARRASSQRDYSTLPVTEQALIKIFYDANIESTLGIGTWNQQWQFWYPLPQVHLPPALIKNPTEE